jgi:hypothetical protein
MLFQVRRDAQSIICFAQQACKQGGGSMDKSSRKDGGRLREPRYHGGDNTCFLACNVEDEIFQNNSRFLSNP